MSRSFVCMCAKTLQSCLTFCHPMDCSLPDSSIHGILQARVLEWAAIFLLQGIFLTQGSNLRLLGLLNWQADSLPLVPPGKLEGVLHLFSSRSFMVIDLIFKYLIHFLLIFVSGKISGSSFFLHVKFNYPNTIYWFAYPDPVSFYMWNSIIPTPFIDLPVFHWEFLHLYSLGILVYTFLS